MMTGANWWMAVIAKSSAVTTIGVSRIWMNWPALSIAATAIGIWIEVARVKPARSQPSIPIISPILSPAVTGQARLMPTTETMPGVSISTTAVTAAIVVTITIVCG